ncbi:MAG: hypothetical protein K6F00_11950 [Lachnospiraceae bacterium]|nr:hypothetical protein [Lachnospiraceae bacterium]
MSIKISRLKKFVKKLKNKKGMSLAETLLAMLIILIVTGTVTNSIKLAVNNYNRSMIRSEAKILYSTLSSIITNELDNTGTITLGDSSDGYYDVIGFFSKTYALDYSQTGTLDERDKLSRFYSVSVDNNGNITGEIPYGQLMLGIKKDGKIIANSLIGTASYTTYDLGAKVSVAYSKTRNTFRVNLEVSDHKDYTLSHSFDVIPLNKPRVI